MGVFSKKKPDQVVETDQKSEESADLRPTPEHPVRVVNIPEEQYESFTELRRQLENGTEVAKDQKGIKTTLRDASSVSKVRVPMDPTPQNSSVSISVKRPKADPSAKYNIEARPEPTRSVIYKSISADDEVRKIVLEKDNEIFALKDSLKLYKERFDETSRKLSKLENDNQNLLRKIEELKSRTEQMMSEGDLLSRNHRREIDVVNEELTIKLEKLRDVETRFGQLNSEYDVLKSRIKGDIRKIRNRERELENRIEIMRRDSASLLKSKDEHIMELKNKIENLEFELDSFRDKNTTLYEDLDSLEGKGYRVLKALKLAISVLEDETDKQDIPNKKKA